MTWTTRPRSDHATLSAITAGQGATILFIHGVGLRAEAWGAQLDALSPHYRAVAVDMPGHGDSALPAGDLDLTDYTDAIAAGTDGPVMVVGHSMGAMIALDMAIRYPGKVQGVAALNAIYRRRPDALDAVQARAASLDGVRMADPSGTLERWFGTDASPEREACHAWLTDVNPAAYKAAYTIFAHQDGPDTDALTALPCPALFMTGADEPNSTPAMSQTMAALAPQGRAQIIDGAAHMMPMTHAADVNAALLDFAKEIWT
ncbi:alpha/beta fold hydrolase [Aliiroseovarius sp. PrR006]|uniref:alpha/beta fold hydrolase n=1 Tax=Aliiroseovarius sp. PrR006 TaxID=2706883 RepID=UPI0013D437E0|nr:alpha/beta hydrolase [Aliiroseovarius sp. PrR006]NDW54461.1 alpha/beta hydrolase [Aliiroseovarius sp. PrR006]